MSCIYDCFDNSELLEGTRVARRAIAGGELVVIPTDTVYGVAADAFRPAAVAKLLAAKGRGRAAPPPVLVPDMATVNALTTRIPDSARRLMEEFWPGALTIVLPANPSLAWDLGDTAGTVAVRIPAHKYARELLAETGPLAVSSANKTGLPAARTAESARSMLGEAVAVYLDGGTVGGEGASGASTIIDATQAVLSGGKLRVLRVGALDVDRLIAFAGDEWGQEYLL